MILDEATSSLDSQSENEISKSIQQLKGKLTIIVVAHRLSTIKEFDFIHVLDKGRVVDSGTHDQLNQSSEIYRSLVELGKL